MSVLTERYSGSPETMFEFDIRRFNLADKPMNYLKSIEAGELSDAYWNNILVTNLDTSVTSSPYFNLFIMAQIYDKDNRSKICSYEQISKKRHPNGLIRMPFPTL